jgi:hypothetical protein
MWWGVILISIGMILLRFHTKWSKILTIKNGEKFLTIYRRGLLNHWFKVQQNICKEEASIKTFHNFFLALKHCELCSKKHPEVFAFMLFEIIKRKGEF